MISSLRIFSLHISNCSLVDTKSDASGSAHLCTATNCPEAGETSQTVLRIAFLACNAALFSLISSRRAWRDFVAGSNGSVGPFAVDIASSLAALFLNALISRITSSFDLGLGAFDAPGAISPESIAAVPFVCSSRGMVGPVGALVP